MPKAKGNGAARKVSAVKDPLNKAQLLTNLSDTTGLPKKDVSAVLDALSEVIHRHLKKRGPGQFTLPGLLKIKTVRKPATPARKGVSPFTGEPITFKAKPARTVVKVQPLKGLKQMVD